MTLTVLSKKIFGYVVKPLQINAPFFVSMYLLGVICAWLTLPHSANEKIYRHLYTELLADLYTLCLLLSILPQRIRPWVRGVLYLILYLTTAVDVFCRVQLDSVITPTMLLLVGETNGREATEFLSSYLSFSILFSKFGWIVLFALSHLAYTLRRFAPKRLKAACQKLSGKLPTISTPLANKLKRYAPIGFTGILIWSFCVTAGNKVALWKLMHGKSVGEVEHMLTEQNHGECYHPVHHLMFSIYANSLASQQLNKLIAAAKTAKVDSCTYTSPHIVLIIGESFGKHHSQQYGYVQPTTPRQIRRERSKQLVKFNDVVSPWNLTSYVFKHVFSLYDVGDRGEWCDYPLFPQLFRKAGYHVTFITNQFLPQAKENVYDFSGGFFLNNPTLNKAMFDTRNDSLHIFDEDLVREYARLKSQEGRHNLTIFHLIGQHVGYKFRTPNDRRRWNGTDYKTLRPDLTPGQRSVLALYDDAVLYNDSVVDLIVKQFESEDAIVIYMPDHGEECYEENRGIVCRNHSAAIDYPLAKYEFEIPFWIWCSRSYIARHPDIYRQIQNARNRRFMTDALPHLLLYLAGIKTKSYREENNLISPKYNENRPRILKGTTDYDKLPRPKPQSVVSNIGPRLTSH